MSKLEEHFPVSKAMIRPRADRLAEQIADAILAGTLVPGTHLDEHALADHFGVSRTPVRDALRQLSGTGLIESRPYMGAIVEISQETIRSLTTESPRLTHALWWATLVDESILREWLTNMGQREVRERMAHLLCELLVRLQTVGRATATGFDLPMIQLDLADVLGSTSVHVNRVLQDLRERKLLVLKGRRVEIPDVPALMAFCGFDPAYLHLEPRVPDAG